MNDKAFLNTVDGGLIEFIYFKYQKEFGIMYNKIKK
jgi:hypothetical protein